MSCLFDSLSKFTSFHDSSNLRKIVCDYLIQNPSLMDDLKAEQIIYYDSKMSLDKYVQKMRSCSTWGGSIEIKSFCNIFNMNVTVINIRDNNERIQFLSNDENDKTQNVEITWSGGHYEPIYKKS